jgi:hypothetical protein
LREVVLPKGLEKLGAGAFFYDSKLTKINLQEAKKLKRLRDFDGIKYKISKGMGVHMGCYIGDDEEL